MSKENISAIRARLKFSSIDEFIQGYARYISSGGIFIPMAPGKLKERGATIRFQFLLGDGSTALLGEGAVHQVHRPTQEAPDAPVGMLVKFTKLSQSSKRIVDQIVALKQSTDLDQLDLTKQANLNNTAAQRSKKETAEYDRAPSRNDESAHTADTAQPPQETLADDSAAATNGAAAAQNHPHSEDPTISLARPQEPSGLDEPTRARADNGPSNTMLGAPVPDEVLSSDDIPASDDAPTRQPEESEDAQDPMNGFLAEDPEDALVQESAPTSHPDPHEDLSDPITSEAPSADELDGLIDDEITRENVDHVRDTPDAYEAEPSDEIHAALSVHDTPTEEAEPVIADEDDYDPLGDLFLDDESDAEEFETFDADDFSDAKDQQPEPSAGGFLGTENSFTEPEKPFNPFSGRTPTGEAKALDDAHPDHQPAATSAQVDDSLEDLFADDAPPLAQDEDSEAIDLVDEAPSIEEEPPSIELDDEVTPADDDSDSDDDFEAGAPPESFQGDGPLPAPTPRKLAQTEGGLEILAYDDASADVEESLEGLSFADDEEDIDSMFDGIFGGGDEDIFGDDLFGDADDAGDEPLGEELLEAPADNIDPAEAPAAEMGEALVDVDEEEMPAQPESSDAFDSSEVFEDQEEMPAAAEANSGLDEFSEDFDIISEVKDTGQPNEAVHGPEEFNVDALPDDPATMSESSAQPVELIQAPDDDDDDDDIFGDVFTGPQIIPEDQEMLQNASDPSIQPALDEEDAPSEELTSLLSHLEDDDDNSLGDLTSLNLQGPSVAGSEEEETLSADDDESLDALLASAQADLDRAQEDDEQEEPTDQQAPQDILDDLLGEDLPPPPEEDEESPFMPLPEPKKKEKKKRGLFSKFFNRDD